MNSNQNQNPVALITGASVRIGEGIARRLHTEGYNLWLHYRNSEQKAKALAEQLNADRKGSVELVTGHLDQADDIACIIAQLLHPVGAFGGRLDVLINNASAFYPTPVKSATLEQWDELFNTNLRAPFLLAQGLARKLAKNKGCIINITDIHGRKPLANHTLYSMTKAALISMTESLAKELAPEIRTNAISPGAILWPEREKDDTDFHKQVLSQVPLNRLGKVENISDTVCYIINNDYLNGQIIAMDGGKSIY